MSNKKIKNIMKGSVTGSVIAPIALVFLGIFLIFIFNKIIANEKSYKDLVLELQSRTFGNKWIAAYELSKHITTHQIPKNDYPWLIKSLSDIYTSTGDSRTRSFVVAALGALKDEGALSIFADALKDKDPDVLFHTIVALGEMPRGISFPWEHLVVLLDHQRPIIRQASALTLATHLVAEAQVPITKLLGDSDFNVRYAAATTLIAYKNDLAVPVLKEALLLKYQGAGETRPDTMDAQQLIDLKLSILETTKRHKWKAMQAIVALLVNDTNKSVSLKAKETLNLLNNYD